LTFFGAPVYVLAGALFALGIFGFLTRRNAIVVLLSVELMLNAANLTFLAAARNAPAGADPNEASAFAVFVILVAAAEAAVGLAVVIALFRHRESLDPDAFMSLRW
jgi:NADH:ubiquinone oxidoreductase subunit K